MIIQIEVPDGIANALDAYYRQDIFGKFERQKDGSQTRQPLYPKGLKSYLQEQLLAILSANTINVELPEVKQIDDEIAAKNEERQRLFAPVVTVVTKEAASGREEPA